MHLIIVQYHHLRLCCICMFHFDPYIIQHLVFHCVKYFDLNILHCANSYTYCNSAPPLIRTCIECVYSGHTQIGNGVFSIYTVAHEYNIKILHVVDHASN